MTANPSFDPVPGLEEDNGDKGCAPAKLSERLPAVARGWLVGTLVVLVMWAVITLTLNQ